MKKVRNIVIGGIQQKVFNLVLVTVLLMMAAYTAVVIYQCDAEAIHQRHLPGDDGLCAECKLFGEHTDAGSHRRQLLR